MNFNDLLSARGIDPSLVLVLRHRPSEPDLRDALAWLVTERPDLFDAYQQTQSEALEPVMQGLSGKGYVASFIAYGAGKALFVGLYSIGPSHPLTPEQYATTPEYKELKEKWGHAGFQGSAARPVVLWFALKRTDFYPEWIGRLVVDWPPPERSWWRRAHRNNITIRAITEDSALDQQVPPWDQLGYSWAQLQIIPKRVQDALREWRGIYYIFDTSDAKGYVGSACGDSNILGRWLTYAASGDGGNKLLRDRDPFHFRFSILQRLSPDMEVKEVIRVENTWKERLHTRAPLGLNSN